MTNESEQRKMEGTLMGRLSPGARAQMTKHTSTEMELPKLHYLSMPLSSSQACHINSSYHCSQLARDCQHIFSCTILLPIGSNLFQTSERCHKYNPPQRYHITNQSNIFSVLLNLVFKGQAAFPLSKSRPASSSLFCLPSSQSWLWWGLHFQRMGYPCAVMVLGVWEMDRFDSLYYGTATYSSFVCSQILVEYHTSISK